MLETLRQWSLRTDLGEGVGGVSDGGKEEKGLAKQLYEDFVRFPPADDVEGHHVKVSGDAAKDGVAGGAGGDGGESKGGAEGGSASQGETKVGGTGAGDANTAPGDTAKDVAAVEAEPVMSAADHKGLGNDKFVAKDYDGALVHYSRAIEIDGSVAQYHGNRAAAFLQRAKVRQEAGQGGEKEGGEEGGAGGEGFLEDVEQCLVDCAAAVRRDPTYVKAGYRAAQALQLKVREGLVWCCVVVCVWRAGWCGGVGGISVGIVLWYVWRRAGVRDER